MKIRVPSWLLLATLLVVAGLLVANLFVLSGRRDGADPKMLKALLDWEIAASARKLFKADYAPKDGRLMTAAEIAEFLSDRKVSLGTLHPDLQRALKQKSAVGVLVSLVESSDGPGTPRRLPRRYMFVAWGLNGQGERGSGALWFNGSGGGGESCPSTEKCDNYFICCHGTPCWCIGLYQCPPCAACKRCAFDEPRW